MTTYQRKILMIGWEYPPHNSGGLGVACEGMTRSLADQNTQIYFTLPYNYSGNVKHMKILNCFDRSWGKASTPPFSAYSSIKIKTSLDKIGAAKLRTLPGSEMERRVSEYADLVMAQAKKIEYDFDVIHAHDWMSLPAAEQLKKKSGKPVIAHVHSTEYDRVPSGNGSSFIIETERRGLAMADRIIAVSYYTKQLLVKKYGLERSKIHVVHNGILPLTTKSQSAVGAGFALKRPVIAFMGRLSLQKGVEHFINLAAHLTQRIPEALFVIAGSGHLYHELLFRTAGNRLSASVLFSGFVRDRQKNRLLDRADVFVMPSISEPFGLVALEAAQRKTPVIISKNAGVSEVLPGSVVVDFWDLDKMTDEITRLLTDEKYHQQVVSNQLKDLKNVNWPKSAKEIRRVYDQVSPTA